MTLQSQSFTANHRGARPSRPASEKLASRGRGSARGRICIVTGELAGPDFNGGIGTTNRALALFLREQGYDVDVLYTRVENGRPFCHRGSFEDQVKAYRQLGVTLSHIDHLGKWNDWLAKSFLSMQHLIAHAYDVAFFDDTHGTAYYPLLARRTGSTELRNTIACVTAHSATQWISELNKQPITTFAEYRLMEMERRSLELADVVKAPSGYILQKYRSYGWKLPDRCVVLPNLIASDGADVPVRKHSAVKEIVFFGRLERRKGLWMFCRALDRLKYRLGDCTVTFLGKFTFEDGTSTGDSLIRYSARWPFPVRILNDYNRDQALAYLRGHGRIAVMPSPEDNSPSAVLECLAEGIPFLTCSGSGAEELLDDETRRNNTCAPTVDGLHGKLVHALDHGVTTGQRSFDANGLSHSLGEFVATLTNRPAADAPQPAPQPAPIVIAVVPAGHDAQSAAAQIMRWVEQYDGEIEIEVMATEPGRLEQELASTTVGGPTAVNVNSFKDYAKIIKALAHRARTEVVLCHIGQIVPRMWLSRARGCLTAHPDIAALTGMCRSLTDGVDGLANENHQADEVSPDRFLLGNASALLSLLQESNSGFAVVRSDVFAMLDRVEPFDHLHDRPRRMADWIHEIMLQLQSTGHSFELLPDELIELSARETPVEAFQLTNVMRSSVQSVLKLAPGSEQAVLAKLAIDTGLEHERSRVNANYLASLSQQVGHQISGNLYGENDEHARQLMMLASAGGQIEMALDVAAAQVAKQVVGRVPTIADLVDSSVHTIDLMATLKSGDYRTLNLDESYSFNILKDASAFELHANPANKGLAALLFPSVDLSGVNRFVCDAQVMHTVRPIRFRIDIASDDGVNHWSADHVVSQGSERTWIAAFPDNMRTTCRVILGVELTNPEHSAEGALTRWTTASFVQRT
jgi:glycosyltransferase involved in cell wall biosynthesis